MAQLGIVQNLAVLRKSDHSIILNGEALGEILLPIGQSPLYCKPGQTLSVFVYADASGEILATTTPPKTQVGTCAYLKVREVNQHGAFLDWGLPKDLLVPHNEQQMPMQVGRSYVVHTHLEKDGRRIVASSKLHRYLEETSSDFQAGQSVELLICGRSDLGYKAVINHTHLGLIFHADVFQPVRIGQTMQGFVKTIREDQKLNLGLARNNQTERDALKDAILDHLKQHGGRSTLTDKSTPELIYKTYGVSKSNYKKALGGLYKQRLIQIGEDHISLSKSS